MALSLPSHAPLPPIRLEDASSETFSHRDQDDDFLYHVTAADRVDDILLDGLTIGAPATVQGGAYQNYSRGKVFLTERSGVDFWKGRIELHLEHGFDDPPAVAVIRVPRALVKNMVPDEMGSKDSQHGAYFTQSPVPAEADIDIVAFHGTRVMPEFTSFSCDGPPSDDDGEAISSGSGPDVTAYMGAHFAKEWTVARKFAVGDGWMKTRFDGEKTKPRVLRCALDIKNPVTFKSEDTLRNLAYLHSISDENTLEPALRREGIELDTPEADAWFEKYDASGELRLETNRWLLEQYRPGEGEEEGLRDAARELAAAAVNDLMGRGHDGIIYANQVEGGTGIVVFEPEQVTMLSVEYLNEKDRPQVDNEELAGKLMKGQAQIAPPEPAKPAKAPKFTVEQAKVLDAMSKKADGFKDWVADLYEDANDRKAALADKEERHTLARDYLEEVHQIQVDQKGIVNFEILSDEGRELIGDFPVRLYHHTASGVIEQIREEGLRPQPGANVNCLGSGSGAKRVFLTAEAGGAAPDVYLGHAVRVHGGEPETLSVVMHLEELEPDQDDSDIKSGRYQFTAPYVAPARIENFAPVMELPKSDKRYAAAAPSEPDL